MIDPVEEADTYGRSGPVVRIRLRRRFDSAHYLPYHLGKCRHLHGHTYTAEFAIDGGLIAPLHPEDDPPSATGMVMDFSDVKQLVDAALPDHRCINSFGVEGHSPWVSPSGQDVGLANPTAEWLALTLYERLAESIANHGCSLAYVRVWETPDGDAQYPAGAV